MSDKETKKFRSIWLLSFYLHATILNYSEENSKNCLQAGDAEALEVRLLDLTFCQVFIKVDYGEEQSLGFEKEFVMDIVESINHQASTCVVNLGLLAET